MKRKRQARNRRSSEEKSHWLLKFGSQMLLGVVIVMVFLTISQCTIKKPESPIWTTNLVVPVVNRTYQMDEIIRKIDQDEISMDSLGNIAFSIEEDLDTVRLGEDNLTADDLSYSISESIGAIPIESPTLAPIQVTFAEIGGFPGAFSGGALPEMSFDVDTEMPTFSNFSTITVDQGMALCVITNDLDVPIDQCVVSLYNTATNPAVRIAFGTLPGTLFGGVTDTVVLSLVGKTLTNELEVRTHCHTPGGPVGNAPLRSFTTQLLFAAGLSASAAVARVPALDPIGLSQPVELALEPGESISSASLSIGLLSISLTNNTALDATVQMTIPELQLGGVAYSVDTLLLASQAIVIQTDLTGYDLLPSSNTVNVSAVANVPGSGDDLVGVSQLHTFNLDATISNLAFGSVTGVFAATEAPFDNITEEIDIPMGFGDIGLNSATLTLEIDNGVDLVGELDIVITGNNGKTLNMTGTIDARGTAEINQTILVNPNVADFLTPLPSEVSVDGAVVFGDGAYSGTITGDDFVAATVRIDAPLDLKIDSAIVDDIDLSKEEINQDDIDRITDNVLNAQFDYTITSHLPLGAEVTILLSGDSASLFAQDFANAPFQVVEVNALDVDPAPVSLATGTGVVSEPVISTGTLALSNEDLQVLKNDTLYIRNTLLLVASDTSGVRLTADDYITITGQFSVEYKFDGEF